MLMKFKHALMIAGVLLQAVAFGAPAESAQRLLIMGDSLSDAYEMPRESGWAALLQQRLGADYQVVNASISGETTAGGSTRIGSLLDQHDPDWLLVILGGNDGLRALSPSQVEANLDAIVQQGLAAGVEVSIMQIRLPPNLGPAYIRRFESIYPRLAERYDVPLFGFFLESIFDQTGMMMSDGIHPTEAAQPLMLDRIWPALTDWIGAD